MFKYQGIERLQLWFYSPNVCATFLVITILLSIGVFIGLLVLKKRWYTFLALFFVGALILIQQLMIAATYSRGGYVGLFAGYVVAWVICRKHAIWAYALSAVVIILLISSGASRIVSIGHVTSDASIINRILLWRGAVGIIANNPISGVAVPGELYHAWYQPLWLNEHYRTMINDALTLGVNLGIWALWLYYLFFLSLLYWGWRYAKIFGKYQGIFACALGAVASYLFCASFSTMYEHEVWDWTIIILLSVTAIALLTGVIITKTVPRRLDYIIPVVASLFIVSVVYTWGIIENHLLPYKWEYSQITLESGKSLTLCNVYPKSDAFSTVICFVGGKWGNDNYYSDCIREIARPLLAKDYAVIIIKADSGIYGTQDAIKFLRDTIATSGDMSFYIFGIGDGAQSAILSTPAVETNKIKKLAVVNPPATWPFEELSPIEFIDKFQGEVLLLSSENNLYDAAELANKRRNRHLPVELVKVENDILTPLLNFYDKLD